MTRRSPDVLLNGICPYFTMFPLDFPYGILARHAKPDQAVLDPFCGRGTTNFAARLRGMYSVGIDASPVAAAIAAAKLVSPTVDEILAEAHSIVAGGPPAEVPEGDFWELAYHTDVLRVICRFREAFLQDCTAPVRIALRGILLGALHGPKRKTVPSYLSNQAPRTYAPKPGYAIRYWRIHGHRPEEINVLGVIERRARRYYGSALQAGKVERCVGGIVRCADSRQPEVFQALPGVRRFSWIITSPPYYGMRTYIPDQWLRNWFVGGPPKVEYVAPGQIEHGSPGEFAAQLRRVWRNVRAVASEDARLVIRFGGVSQRKADPREVLKASFTGSGWRVVAIRRAGNAKNGYRQADGFLKEPNVPVDEFDVWAKAE